MFCLGPVSGPFSFARRGDDGGAPVARGGRARGVRRRGGGGRAARRRGGGGGRATRRRGGGVFGPGGDGVGAGGGAPSGDDHGASVSGVGHDVLRDLDFRKHANHF